MSCLGMRTHCSIRTPFTAFFNACTPASVTFVRFRRTTRSFGNPCKVGQASIGDRRVAQIDINKPRELADMGRTGIGDAASLQCQGFQFRQIL